MTTPATTLRPSSPAHSLRLGFVPLTDCAPLIVAQEFGFYRKYGLHVTLSRELGWASIRDKVIYRELDAAHAVAGLPFVVSLGLGSIRCDCLTALILNLHGNALTLSNELWRRGVRDAPSLREEITRVRRERTITLGVAFNSSSHHFLLRQWLTAAGIDPARDVHIAVVPPPQMVANLKAGHLDGFCVGEPWNSVAVQARVGWCAAASAELAPGHPEKVLMVRREFAEQRAEDHLALVAALVEACAWCDQPEHHAQLVALLARPEYVGASETTLRCAFQANFDFGHAQPRSVPDFHLFHRDGANEPSGARAAWVLEQLRRSGLSRDASVFSAALGNQVFRPDLFDQALRLHSSSTPSNENILPTESTLAHA